MNTKTIPMRALSILLCLVMVFSLLPISALANNNGTGGGGTRKNIFARLNNNSFPIHNYSE